MARLIAAVFLDAFYFVPISPPSGGSGGGSGLSLPESEVLGRFRPRSEGEPYFVLLFRPSAQLGYDLAAVVVRAKRSKATQSRTNGQELGGPWQPPNPVIGFLAVNYWKLNFDLRAMLECGVFAAVWPSIRRISGGLRPPGAVATEIRAGSTSIRR
jgi:hypothetical protein